MEPDYGDFTVGDLAFVASFDFSDLSQFDWSLAKNYLIEQGLYTAEVASVISMFEAGDFSLLFEGIEEIRWLVANYPPDTLLSEIYGGEDDDGNVVPDYSNELMPTFDDILGIDTSPLYDLLPDGSWSVPGIGDFSFGGARDGLLQQIADTSLEQIIDQVQEGLSQIGIPGPVLDGVRDMYDQVERVQEVYDIVTNFHTNVFKILTDGVSMVGITAEEFDQRIDEAVGQFRNDAHSFISADGVDWAIGIFHVEEVNSFRANYWSPGDVISGGAKRDSILANAMDDFVRPGGGADVVYTMSGDDVISLDDDGANDIINGGDGLDIVTFWGSSRDVQLVRDSGVVSLTVGSNTDTLTSIERIEFDDGVVAFDTDGNAGQAYRLYQAAFERTPDAEGLGYWIDRLDSGDTSLNSIADSFLSSPEFVRTYGTEETVSNSGFVELLYLHTLGRDYDPEGFNYWVEHLDQDQTNRGDLLAFFSESNENKAKVADAIGDGIWYA